MKTHIQTCKLTTILAVVSLSGSVFAASTTPPTKSTTTGVAKSSATRSTPATTTATTPAEHREHIKATVNATATRPITVTSEHRDNSAAHRRGAVDIRSKDTTPAVRHTEAKEISKALGGGYTVVVEEVHRVDHKRGVQGPEAQVNTAYRNGTQGNTRVGPIPKPDSATHTHIQPNAPAKKK